MKYLLGSEEAESGVGYLIVLEGYAKHGHLESKLHGLIV